MKKRKLLTRILVIILVIAMLAGSGFYLIYMISPASLNVYAASSKVSDDEAYKKLEDLKEMIELIQKNYKDNVTAKELVDAAYSGVFDALDQWSTYYATSEDEANFKQSLTKEQYAGVGLTITAKEALSVVSFVNPKGPCKAAGILRGDIITAVNGRKIKGMDIDKVSELLRGKAGTKVKISVLRGTESKDFTVVRANIAASHVDYYMIDNQPIGYIGIATFGDDCAIDFAAALRELKKLGAKSFIIDLRDNPGGYMDEALDCASLLLKSGDTIIRCYKKGKEVDRIVVPGNDKSKRDKVVLLVNNNSASAAEVFTAALKDNKAAKVVGETTYGKGVAQEIITLGDGSSFKLSTMYFTGPNRKAIDGVGIKPDYVVSGDDAQLAKAIELAK